MENNENLHKILADNSLTDSLFDSYRLVDINTNTICEIIDNTIINTNTPCFNTWERNKTCDNCISFRAYMENKQIVKIENRKNIIFLIIAVPVVVSGEKFVLELVKDISTSLIVDPESVFNENRLDAIIKKVNKLAITDSDTDLYIKKYSDKQIPEDIKHSILSNSSLTAIMLKLDDFKNINDLYGTHTGDLFVFRVSQLILKNIDSLNSWASRYCREKFLIVFKNYSMGEVATYCENLKKDINDIEVMTKEEILHITASYGIYEFNSSVDDKDTFMEKVNTAMVRAEKNGKNQICIL